MVLNGLLTTQQLIIAIVVILAIILMAKFIKGVVKFIVMACVTCFLLVYLGIASPEQLRDVPTQIANKGIEFYKEFEQSSNIKVDSNTIKIKTDDETWLDVKDIKSFKANKDGTVIINANDKDYTVTDENVANLLKTFS